MNKKALNIGGFMGLVLVVSVIILGWTIILGDLQKSYIATNISRAEIDDDEVERIESTFDRAAEINESLSKTFEQFQNIEKEGDLGFLNILAGIAAVPKAILSFILAIGKSFDVALGLLVEAGTELKVPPSILVIGMFGIFIFIVFKLVELWRRYPTT